MVTASGTGERDHRRSKIMIGEVVGILGGGNTAFAVAAKLALEGHRVRLWEHPSQATAISGIASIRQIRLTGVGGEGSATLECVSTAVADVLDEATLLLAPVPSYAQAAFLDAISANLSPRHVLAFLPGNSGTLAASHRFRGAGKIPAPLLIESDTAPYVCRKLGPDHVHVFGVVPAMGVGALPSSRSDEAVALLEPLFPGVVAYPHALAAALGAMNPIVHPPGVLMNAGRIEYSRGDFYFYEEGVTPGVVRVIEALDSERRTLGAALGLSLLPVADAFHSAGFGPKGDLWATINGSRMLTALRAPGSLQTRWLSEDIPFGLRTWVGIGEQLGVAMPVARALIELGNALMGSDAWSVGRGPAELGILGLDRSGIEGLLS